MGLFSKNNKDIEIDFSSKGMTAISKGSTVVGDIISSKLILEKDSYFEGKNQKKQSSEYIEMK